MSTKPTLIALNKRAATGYVPTPTTALEQAAARFVASGWPTGDDRRAAEVRLLVSNPWRRCPSCDHAAHERGHCGVDSEDDCGETCGCRS